MIERVPLLTPQENHALSSFIARIVLADEPRILRVLLFGSRARGDFDADSDIDLLLICDLPHTKRDEAARTISRNARALSRETGLELETWTISVEDLDLGWRTPMLVDAIEDGITLWPPDAPKIHLPFTPADARFCTLCLLDWVESGSEVIEMAIARGEWEVAAGRARDDITRLAAAALLMIGETRHRRIGSLTTFEEYFIGPGFMPGHLIPALRWAEDAYPPGGGRGSERPKPTPSAVASAERGYRLSRMMARETVPFLAYFARRDASEASSSVDD